MQLELDVEAMRRPVIFMCLGADIDIVIPEQDQTRPRQGTSIQRVTRKTKLFRFGPDNPAIMRIEEDAGRMRIKLIHGDVLMLRGGDRKVCPCYVL